MKGFLYIKHANRTVIEHTVVDLVSRLLISSFLYGFINLDSAAYSNIIININNPLT